MTNCAKVSGTIEAYYWSIKGTVQPIRFIIRHWEVLMDITFFSPRDCCKNVTWHTNWEICSIDIICPYVFDPGNKTIENIWTANAVCNLTYLQWESRTTRHHSSNWEKNELVDTKWHYSRYKYWLPRSCAVSDLGWVKSSLALETSWVFHYLNTVAASLKATSLQRPPLCNGQFFWSRRTVQTFTLILTSL